MQFIPDGHYCFDIINIDLEKQETEIKFCDYYEDGYFPKCLLKNVELEDGTKICTEKDFQPES